MYYRSNRRNWPREVRWDVHDGGSMREKLADLAFRLGLLKLVASFGRGRGTILMLHEVHADEALARFEGCTAGQLEFILSTLRKWEIDLIAIDELLPRLGSGDPRPFAVITFDDGYRDNLTNALPILERHRAPALISVPTQAVTRELCCWWLALRELFMTRDSLDFEPLDCRFALHSPEARLMAYRQARAWIAADFTRAWEHRSWFESEGISFPDLCSRFFMDEHELRACAAHPLITIGGHATTHRSLASLPDGEMRWELSANKAYLENLLQVTVEHLVYPYGGKDQCGVREAAGARDAGYKSAIAVRHGRLDASTVADPFLMPRQDAGYHGMTERQLYGIVNGLYGIRAGLRGA